MPIVANTYTHIVGIDTHAATHTYAVVACPGGALIDQATFPTTGPGRQRALAWIARRTTSTQTSTQTGAQAGAQESTVRVLAVVEGTGSYGALISADLAHASVRVVEAPTPVRAHGKAKTDLIDATAAARSTMSTELTSLRDRRGTTDETGQVRGALAVLCTAREHLNTERLAAINALTALTRTHDLDLDTRRALTTLQIAQITRWRPQQRRHEPLATATARTEAVRLATQITRLDTDLATNRARTATLTEAHAPHLTQHVGIGPVVAATVLVAWSHPGRLKSEAAMAMLAGTAPIEASSGNTTRHRLNRGGDRRLNKAIHTIALTRMRCDPETRAYVERRRQEGKPDREIRRCLKRYITRQLYRDLTNPHRHQPLDNT